MSPVSMRSTDASTRSGGVRWPLRHTSPGSSLMASASSGSSRSRATASAALPSYAVGAAAPSQAWTQVVGEDHDPGDGEDAPRRSVASGQQREARDELGHVRPPHRVLDEQHEER